MDNKETAGYEIYIPVEGSVQETVIPTERVKKIKYIKIDYFYEILSTISVLIVISSIIQLGISKHNNANLLNFIIGYCIMFIPHCIIYYYIKFAIKNKIPQVVNLTVAIIINSILIIVMVYTYTYLLYELITEYMFGILSYLVYIVIIYIYDLCTLTSNKDIKFGLSTIIIILSLIVYNTMKKD